MSIPEWFLSRMDAFMSLKIFSQSKGFSATMVITEKGWRAMNSQMLFQVLSIDEPTMTDVTCMHSTLNKIQYKWCFKINSRNNLTLAWTSLSCWFLAFWEANFFWQSEQENDPIIAPPLIRVGGWVWGWLCWGKTCSTCGLVPISGKPVALWWSKS